MGKYLYSGVISVYFVSSVNKMVEGFILSILKYPIIHKVMVDEDTKQCTFSISNQKIIIALFWWLSSNLFCILKNIPTIVGISCRGGSFKCGIYLQFILINIHIRNKLCFVRGG